MKDWPIYYKHKLHIGDVQSNVGLVTLWTPTEALISKVSPENYCLAGQLYSKRGINYIIRNILANPLIDTLVVCGANLSGSAEALLGFCAEGVDEQHNVIGVDKAAIDQEIDKDSLEIFRKNIQCINLVGSFNVNVVNKELLRAGQKGKKHWTRPILFPEAETKTADKFPSEKNTFTVRTDYIWQAWPQILKYIMKFGSTKGMIKVGEVKELINIVTVIEEENPYKPEIPAWFTFSKEDLKLYYQGFFAKEASSEDYNYGQRIFSHPLGVPYEKYNSSNNTKRARKLLDTVSVDSNDACLNQLEEVYVKLKRYKYDRGAVISIWNSWTDNIATGWMSDTKAKTAGNVPCMTQLQFAYREHKLQLTAYFRSNDMFDAWPRNAFALRKLQFDLAKKLGMKPGSLTTISSLGQIYEHNYEEARSVVDKFNNVTNCRFDMRGNVVIEVEDKDIVLKHMDTSGNEVLEEFRIDGTLPKSAQQMSDKLLQNMVFSEIPHAMDIARELMKAEIAIKNGLVYTQDREMQLTGRI